MHYSVISTRYLKAVEFGRIVGVFSLSVNWAQFRCKKGYFKSPSRYVRVLTITFTRVNGVTRATSGGRHFHWLTQIATIPRCINVQRRLLLARGGVIHKRMETR